MIKLNLVVVFYFFLSTNIFSQNSSGKITYKIANIDFVDKGGNADATAMLSIAKTQQYQLLFNNEQISFRMLESMSNESTSAFHNKLAKIYVSNSDFYFDYKNNHLLESKNDGTILEQKIQKLSWKITNETKMIDNYKCYRATYSFEYMARDYKMKTRIITAWFAPNLPYPYGPKNYHGLPGLILELTDRTVTFLVSKIELSDKQVEIKIPSGQRISKDEYEKAILRN
jgi:GLPGLI family protein